jgi:hypothetical protein
LVPGDLEATVAIVPSNSVIPLQMLWMRGGFPKSLLAMDEEESFAWRERYIDNLCARG